MSSFGRRLTRREVGEIIRGMRAEPTVSIGFRFIRLIVPAAAAIALVRPRWLPGPEYVGPTTLEYFAAAVLVLFSVKALIDTIWIER